MRHTLTRDDERPLRRCTLLEITCISSCVLIEKIHLKLLCDASAAEWIRIACCEEARLYFDAYPCVPTEMTEESYRFEDSVIYLTLETL